MSSQPETLRMRPNVHPPAPRTVKPRQLHPAVFNWLGRLYGAALVLACAYFFYLFVTGA